MRTEQDARRDPRPTDRDTAPQQPNPPSRYKGRCDMHGIRVCDECQYGETDAKLLDAAEKRIAALEAQLAEAQARLAMVCASTWPWVEMSEPHREEWVTELAYRESVEKWVCVKDALAATAPAVAEFVQKVERSGAAKYREAALDFVGYVIASRTTNQPDYMLGLAEEINKFCASIGDEGGVEFHGDGFRIVRKARADELEGK